MTEAKAWVKKYLIEASVVNGEWDMIISGIKDIRLISRLNQASSQDEEDSAISVLTNREKMRNEE